MKSKYYKKEAFLSLNKKIKIYLDIKINKFYKMTNNNCKNDEGQSSTKAKSIFSLRSCINVFTMHFTALNKVKANKFPEIYQKINCLIEFKIFPQFWVIQLDIEQNI